MEDLAVFGFKGIIAGAAVSNPAVQGHDPRHPLRDIEAGHNRLPCPAGIPGDDVHLVLGREGGLEGVDHVIRGPEVLLARVFGQVKHHAVKLGPLAVALQAAPESDPGHKVVPGGNAGDRLDLGVREAGLVVVSRRAQGGGVYAIRAADGVVGGVQVQAVPVCLAGGVAGVADHALGRAVQGVADGDDGFRDCLICAG